MCINVSALLNEVTLIGRVGVAPETRGSDKSVVTFPLATNFYWKDKGMLFYGIQNKSSAFLYWKLSIHTCFGFTSQTVMYPTMQPLSFSPDKVIRALQHVMFICLVVYA